MSILHLNEGIQLLARHGFGQSDLGVRSISHSMLEEFDSPLWNIYLNIHHSLVFQRTEPLIHHFSINAELVSLVASHADDSFLLLDVLLVFA